MRLFILLLIAIAPSMLTAQSQFSLHPKSNGQQAPAVLLGVWGNARQCAAYLAGQDTHPLLHPYHISADWLRQGPHHCSLNWQNSQERQGTLEAMVLAQCGEDDLRDYRLVLRQQGGRLHIRWSEDFTTGELLACR